MNYLFLIATTHIGNMKQRQLCESIICKAEKLIPHEHFENYLFKQITNFPEIIDSVTAIMINLFIPKKRVIAYVTQSYKTKNLEIIANSLDIYYNSKQSLNDKVHGFLHSLMADLDSILSSKYLLKSVIQISHHFEERCTTCMNQFFTLIQNIRSFIRLN